MYGSRSGGALSRDEKLRWWLTTGAWILVVAAAYFASGKLGLLEQIVVGGVRVTPLWPPTGVAVAGLLLLGVRVWPGIAMGELLIILTFGPPTWSSLGIIAGATLAPLAAYLLLCKVDFRIELDRLRDGVALVFLGAFSAMVISASMALLVLQLEGSVPSGQFWPVWCAWWTGDAMGVLVVAPLLFAGWFARLPRDTPPLRWFEAALLLALTVAVTLVVTRSSLDLLFLTLPLVMWAALRFQLPGAAPCVLVISILAVAGASHHHGPFSRHGLLATMVVLQALDGAVALTGLLLAAVVAERNNTMQSIERACADLTEVVARLAPGEARVNPWLGQEPPTIPSRPPSHPGDSQ